MSSSFNPQILIEKLAKLNNSQTSIETLSHWCIFHMNKAKLVVDTWDKQFHCSPREQRLAFLYLANDILQNSRRKGADFVAEFWRVLPDALRDVVQSGGGSGRNEALRLINIWDERKVFGSRGHMLKEEFLGRQSENNSKTPRSPGMKLRQFSGSLMDKIVSDYEVIYGGQLDEEALLSKCRNSVSSIEKITNDISGNMSSGQFDGNGFVEKLQGQHSALRGCIDQLTALEALRVNLVSHMREALQEQELKLDLLRNQLQVAHCRSDEAASTFQKLLNSNHTPLGEKDQASKEAQTPNPAVSQGNFHPNDSGDQQSNAVVYTRQMPSSFSEQPSGSTSLVSAGTASVMDGKSAAAAVAAKLTASTSSAQMLSLVLSSLAKEGVIGGNGVKDSTASNLDHPPEKKPRRLDSDAPYVPSTTNHQPPGFSAPNSSNKNNQMGLREQQPAPPSSSPPPHPPLPPMMPFQMPPPFMHAAAGSMSNVPYTYGSGGAPQHLLPPPLQPPAGGYSPVGPPPSTAHYVPSSVPPPPSNAYQGFQGSEGSSSGFYGQNQSLPMAPISRQ